LLRTALENLLANAWKFTGRKPAARIELGVKLGGAGAIYFVKDNGAGFDMSYADKLFNAFQRLHAIEDFPGTGIGLATVQRIAQRHGGRTWAEAEVDKGATFFFTLTPEGESDGNG
jgi:light-regulated signal transduction histidine kinase (bacteriophytochrome)